MPVSKNNRIKFYFFIIIFLPTIIFAFAYFLFFRSEYDMSGITFSDSIVLYDGSEHSIEIDGNLPDGVSVSYYYNLEKSSGETEVGTYSVIARFSGSISYQSIDDMTATLVISDEDYEIAGLSFSDKTVTYDGQLHSIEIEGTLPSYISVSYTYDDEELDGETEVGVYTVVATLSDSTGTYDNMSVSATLTIEGIDVSDILSDTLTFNDDTVDYDGYSHSLEVVDVPDSFDATYTYNGEDVDSVTEVGTYTVVAVLTPEDNHYADVTLTATLDITYTTDYEYDVTDDTASLTSYNGSESEIIVPEEVEDNSGNIYTVTSISDYCFAGSETDYNTTITSIEINDGITSIGDYVFYYCIDLESIVLPDNITEIGEYCFYECLSLTSIELPASLITIKNHAFSYCASLTNITFNSNLESIGASCFYECVGLTSIELPASLTTIDSYAFHSCSSLVSVTFNEGLTELSSYCFYECTLLSEVTLPTTLTSIGRSCFYDTAIQSITIPDNVEELGKYCFAYCSNLESITLNEGLIDIDGWCFYKCLSLNSIELPSTVESIGRSCFYYCYALESVELDDALTSLGTTAFSDCTSLTTITLPSNLETIGKSCFEDCTALTTIKFEDTTASWYTSTSSGETDNLIDITSSATNVTHFTDTYVEYYWTKG